MYTTLGPGAAIYQLLAPEDLALEPPDKELRWSLWNVFRVRAQVVSAEEWVPPKAFNNSMCLPLNESVRPIARGATGLQRGSSKAYWKANVRLAPRDHRKRVLCCVRFFCALCACENYVCKTQVKTFKDVGCKSYLENKVRFKKRKRKKAGVDKTQTCV